MRNAVNAMQRFGKPHLVHLIAVSAPDRSSEFDQGPKPAEIVNVPHLIAQAAPFCKRSGEKHEQKAAACPPDRRVDDDQVDKPRSGDD
ncbi:MAG TPA: hypothetical protein VFZ37_16675 [Jiangellaceae bacterium]